MYEGSGKIDDLTGHELQQLTIDTTDAYKIPEMPCGILPFFIENNKIYWRCVETDRVGVVVTVPPAGTQDIIAINPETLDRISLEYSKSIQIK